ncbi:MAG: SDR family oxidoreductase [Thermaerobacterales bacterium]
MYPELVGKTALVTGASRGFGRAIALRLASEKAHVVVNYRRSRTEAERVVEEIRDSGGQATAIRADVGKDEASERLIEEIAGMFGSLDILVANAAFGIPGPLLQSTPRYWDVTMAASAESFLRLTQRVVPLMPAGGRIISITSDGGQKVVPGYGIVGVAKAALECLTRGLAVELAPQGIRVNGVLSGLADTRSFRAIPGAAEMLQESVRRTPAGRPVVPGDVANAVAFLCSDQAGMVCGQFLVIDGGQSVLI